MLRLTPLAEPLVEPAEQWSFRRLVVGLFGFRRKQMLRGLRELTGWEAGASGRRARPIGVPAAARPEVVAPATFAALLRALVDGGWTAR